MTTIDIDRLTIELPLGDGARARAIAGAVPDALARFGTELAPQSIARLHVPVRLAGNETERQIAAAIARSIVQQVGRQGAPEPVGGVAPLTRRGGS